MNVLISGDLRGQPAIADPPVPTDEFEQVVISDRDASPYALLEDGEARLGEAYGHAFDSKNGRRKAWSEARLPNADAHAASSRTAARRTVSLSGGPLTERHVKRKADRDFAPTWFEKFGARVMQCVALAFIGVAWFATAKYIQMGPLAAFTEDDAAGIVDQLLAPNKLLAAIVLLLAFGLKSFASVFGPIGQLRYMKGLFAVGTVAALHWIPAAGAIFGPQANEEEDLAVIIELMIVNGGPVLFITHVISDICFAALSSLVASTILTRGRARVVTVAPEVETARALIDGAHERADSHASLLGRLNGELAAYDAAREAAVDAGRRQ